LDISSSLKLAITLLV